MCLILEKVCKLISNKNSGESFVVVINNLQYHFQNVISVDTLTLAYQTLNSFKCLFLKIPKTRLNNHEIDKSSTIKWSDLKHELNLDYDFEYSFFTEHFSEFDNNLHMTLRIHDVECILSVKSLGRGA